MHKQGCLEFYLVADGMSINLDRTPICQNASQISFSQIDRLIFRLSWLVTGANFILSNARVANAVSVKHCKRALREVSVRVVEHHNMVSVND